MYERHLFWHESSKAASQSSSSPCSLVIVVHCNAVRFCHHGSALLPTSLSSSQACGSERGGKGESSQRSPDAKPVERFAGPLPSLYLLHLSLLQVLSLLQSFLFPPLGSTTTPHSLGRLHEDRRPRRRSPQRRLPSLLSTRSLRLLRSSRTLPSWPSPSSTPSRSPCLQSWTTPSKLSCVCPASPSGLSRVPGVL